MYLHEILTECIYVTIQLKAIACLCSPLNFPVRVLVLTFQFVDETIKKCLSIELNGFEHYFSLVLFLMLYNVVRIFKFADEILKCNNSTESQ